MPGTTTSNDLLRQGHQGGVDSGYVNPLFVEQYGDAVEHALNEDSFLRNFVNVKTIQGTDTLSNDQIGKTSLQKVTRGVRPTDSGTTFDSVSIKVDTMILARTNQHKMEDFFGRFDVRREVGIEHGESISNFTEEAFLVQGIKACQLGVAPHGGGAVVGGWSDAVKMNVGDMTETVPPIISRSAPVGFNGGTVVVMQAANDDEVADDLELAIQQLVQGLKEKNVKIANGVLLLRPKHYHVLLRNDRLMDKDFSTGNGDYAKGIVLKAVGLRVKETNFFPDTAHAGGGDDHFLSNAGNNFAYNVSTVDTNCVAVLILPKALLAGETIPLTSDVYYVKQELQWFIDSYLMLAVTTGRPDMAGGIFQHDPTA